MFDTKKSVLIIDDMMMIRKIVKKSLVELDYKNVIEASNGQEAWEILEANVDRIGLIVSDWNMPVMTGIDFLRKVRTTETTKNVPFIFLTAEADMAQVKLGLEVGADNYILKPFSPNDLMKKIEQTYNKIKARTA